MQAGGGCFLPFFIGYIIGNTLGRSSTGTYAGRPIYYTDAKG